GCAVGPGSRCPGGPPRRANEDPRRDASDGRTHQRAARRNGVTPPGYHLSMERAVGYARLGSQRIAYEVFGAGPVDLVLTTGSFSAFDTDWEDPMAELF